MTRAERTRGWCCQCDKDRVGRIAGQVEQNSGPGQVVIICEPCENALRAKHAALNARSRQRP